MTIDPSLCTGCGLCAQNCAVHAIVRAKQRLWPQRIPIQIGMCWGRNTKLNCLENHRDSEGKAG